MDRMRACGVCDLGSIPSEGTKCVKQANCFACEHFVSRSLFFKHKKQRDGVAKNFCDGKNLLVTKIIILVRKSLYKFD